MTNIKNYTTLSLTVLVLFWSVHVRSEQFELQAEGRIDKVDVIGSIDPSVKVGASFLFVLSYDTQEKGTFLVRGLTIGSVGYLSGDEAFYCSVYHSSKVGDWERLRLTIETIKSSGTGSSDAGGGSINVKLAFDSSITSDLDPAVTHPYRLSFKGRHISLAKGEVFFHLVYSHNGGAEGLISGEITSLTKLDG